MSEQKTMKAGTAEVIQLFQTESEATSGGYSGEPANFFENPNFQRHFKSLVESAVFDATIKARFLDVKEIDDPFDAIYLAELTPDDIHTADLDRIARYSSIKDLSDTISFDDGWED